MRDPIQYGLTLSSEEHEPATLPKSGALCDGKWVIPGG